MSHFVSITTAIKDQRALINALKRLGFNTVEVNILPQNLYGYKGDVRFEKAHIIIRKKYMGRSSNDMGFERTANGKYIVHISEYDQGTGQYAGQEGTYGRTWQTKLFTYYGVEKAKLEFKRQGMEYTEDLDKEGRPRLKVLV